MDDQSGLGPATEGPFEPPSPESPELDPTTAASDRTQGLRFETCYRHPTVVTGVHCTRCGKPICTDCMHSAAVGYQCPDCLKEAGTSMPRGRRTLTVGRSVGRLTRMIMTVNVVVFVVEVALGGQSALLNGPTPQRLLDMGALYPPYVAGGQYWRLITAMFLHIGLLHIAFNMYALYLFGTVIEDAFGPARFLTIYFVTGFLASVASFTFGPVIAAGAGASGAIFGLLGAWVAYNFRRRDSALASANLRGAVSIIVLNVMILFFFSGIDWRAHLGGLIGGLAAGSVAEGFGTRNTRRAARIIGFAALIAIGVVVAAVRASTLRHSLPPSFLHG